MSVWIFLLVEVWCGKIAQLILEYRPKATRPEASLKSNVIETIGRLITLDFIEAMTFGPRSQAIPGFANHASGM